MRLFPTFVLCGLALLLSRGAGAAPGIQTVSEIPAGRHPQILYWFFKQNSIDAKQYRADLDRIAKERPFSLIFLTSRGGPSFYDSNALHPVFADLVNYAHSLGLKVGIQFFAQTQGAPLEQATGLVEEQALVLDAQGDTQFEAEARNLRSLHNRQAISRQVLAAYAFRAAGDGTYDPATLVALTSKDYVADNRNPEHLTVRISLGARYAGYSVYAMTVHYLPYGDLFSPFFEQSFGVALTAYRDIPFDGTALDEFGNLRIRRMLDGDPKPWRERWYSPAFARLYQAQTGTPLERALFDMRYAPQGDDTPRVTAINHYFDLWRGGVLKVERAFYAKSKELFGPACFAGVHDTFHNELTNDEYWATGINWWSIPREYGQTDEQTPMPTRFGIALGHVEKIPYNMFYDRSVATILDEAAWDASYNVRVHYHAFNDFPTQWGADLRDPVVLQRIGAAERKVRLLNQFDGPEPAMSILVVFGFPALANWYPHAEQRNAYDLNGTLAIEQKAKAIWDAGYLCALIPSDKIDEGAVTIEGPNRIVYGGHVFSSVVYLDPEYAKEANLTFLERLGAAGCKYLITGDASRDFAGHDIAARFAAIRAAATAVGFDLASLPKLGAVRNDIPNGCRLVDGSVLLVDHGSFVGGRSADFKVQMGSSTYSGTYSGLLALKVKADGTLEKLAASGLQSLRRDESVLLSLKAPTDLFLTNTGNGPQGLVRSANGSPIDVMALH